MLDNAFFKSFNSPHEGTKYDYSMSSMPNMSFFPGMSLVSILLPMLISVYFIHSFLSCKFHYRKHRNIQDGFRCNLEKHSLNCKLLLWALPQALEMYYVTCSELVYKCLCKSAITVKLLALYFAENTWSYIKRDNSWIIKVIYNINIYQYNTHGIHHVIFWCLGRFMIDYHHKLYEGACYHFQFIYR